MPTDSLDFPDRRIEHTIRFLRNQKVILDEDLAAMYAVQTKALVRATQRNLDRFPEDFMFQLTPEEFETLEKQLLARPQRGRGGRRYAPYAFTEQGVAMLSSVLRSKRAILVNVEIMRAFVRLRQILATHADLARKLAQLEKKYDARFQVVFQAIRELMESPPRSRRRPIGFRPEKPPR